VAVLEAGPAGAAGGVGVTLTVHHPGAAFGDMTGTKSSLHRSWRDAKFFYALFTAVVVIFGLLSIWLNDPTRLATAFGLVLFPTFGGQSRDVQLRYEALPARLATVPVAWDGKPGTVNFWSKQKGAFPKDSYPKLKALADAVVGKS